MCIRDRIEQGYKIVARNFSGRSGEIDIIARDGEYLVFVEVEYLSLIHI